MSKSHWFSMHLPTIGAGKALRFSTLRTNDGRKNKTKIQPPTPGTSAIKRRSRARKRRRARQELCSYPTLHVTSNKKEELGAREYGHHIRPGKTAHLKAGNPGRSIKMLEEAADQWKTVSTPDRASTGTQAHAHPHRLQCSGHPPGSAAEQEQ